MRGRGFRSLSSASTPLPIGVAGRRGLALVGGRSAGKSTLAADLATCRAVDMRVEMRAVLAAAMRASGLSGPPRQAALHLRRTQGDEYLGYLAAAAAVRCGSRRPVFVGPRCEGDLRGLARMFRLEVVVLLVGSEVRLRRFERRSAQAGISAPGSSSEFDHLEEEEGLRKLLHDLLAIPTSHWCLHLLDVAALGRVGTLREVLRLCGRR